MKKMLEAILFSWPKEFIRETDLAVQLPGSADARHSCLKRAVKAGILLTLKRGLYLIAKPYNNKLPNLQEIAQLLYGPSYISLESALSLHHWIPEAVYTITSVTPKRKVVFNTPLGEFNFSSIPATNFYMGVERQEMNGSVVLIASPWKALADYIYIYKKTWNNVDQLSLDLRIEPQSLRATDHSDLYLIAAHYPNKTVQKFFRTIMNDWEIGDES